MIDWAWFYQFRPEIERSYGEIESIKMRDREERRKTDENEDMVHSIKV